MSKEHTPTPWTWQDFGRGPILVSSASGRPIVMDFVRQGMNGAEPRFGKRTDSMGGIMVPLSKWETEPPDLKFMLRAANAHDALVDAITSRATDAAIKCELGVSEWRSFLTDKERAALALADKDS